MSEEEKRQIEEECLLNCSKAEMIEKYIYELEESSKLSELWCKSQQENQQLKEKLKWKTEVSEISTNSYNIEKEKSDLYKEIIEEVREYIKHEWFKRGQLGIMDKSFQEWELNKLLQILDKAKENK